jgi:hypothetical protein
MRISIIFLLILACLNADASDDKDMKDLFRKYDEVMQEHKVEHVDEIFTEKFLKDNGGKDEFVAKVKELPKPKKKKGLGKLLQRWKKSKVGKIFFAKVSEEGSSHQHDSQFIVIRGDDGKLRIDGTMSDAE